MSFWAPVSTSLWASGHPIVQRFLVHCTLLYWIFCFPVFRAFFFLSLFCYFSGAYLPVTSTESRIMGYIFFFWDLKYMKMLSFFPYRFLVWKKTSSLEILFLFLSFKCVATCLLASSIATEKSKTTLMSHLFLSPVFPFWELVDSFLFLMIKFASVYVFSFIHCRHMRGPFNLFGNSWVSFPGNFLKFFFMDIFFSFFCFILYFSCNVYD